MSERDGYAPGVPCFVDTWQADAEAAAAFYAAVLGWDVERDGDGYHLCRLRGRAVAGIGRLPAEGAHRPAAWMTHVQVQDAEEVARRVQGAGGSVRLGPFDARDGGRIAIVADPDGAHLAVWEQGRLRGAELVNEPGAWSWSQLHSHDPQGAIAFHRAVFGWETDSFGEGEDAVIIWRLPGYVGGEPGQPVPRDAVAGMSRMAPGRFPDGVPPHWQVDFWVDDVDAVAARASEHGGSVLSAPVDGDFFRQALLADPAGATFSVTCIQG